MIPAIIAGVARVGAVAARVGSVAARAGGAAARAGGAAAKSGAKQGVEQATKTLTANLTYGAMTNTMNKRQPSQPDPDATDYYPR